MEAIAAAAGGHQAVVYDCFASKEELFEALLEREEQRVLAEIQASLPPDADVEDPEPLLRRGFTAFLRAVAASPDAYRIIFLGEGASTALAQRIQRARGAQIEAVAALARGSLEGRDSEADLDAAARLFGTMVVGWPSRGRARCSPIRRPGTGDARASASPHGGAGSRQPLVRARPQPASTGWPWRPGADAALADVDHVAKPSRCRIEAASPLRLPPLQTAAIVRSRGSSPRRSASSP